MQRVWPEALANFSRGRDKRRLRRRRPGGFPTAETKRLRGCWVMPTRSVTHGASYYPVVLFYAALRLHASSCCAMLRSCRAMLSCCVMLSCCATPSCLFMMCQPYMLSHAVMHCRDVWHVISFRTMLGHAVMHCRDACHVVPFICFMLSHAIMHSRDVCHVISFRSMPYHAPSCIFVMCLSPLSPSPSCSPPHLTFLL